MMLVIARTTVAMNGDSNTSHMSNMSHMYS